jgi:hypothetical protein
MSDLDAPSEQPSQGVADGLGKAGLIGPQLPFLAILALAIGGVAYTSVSHRPLVGYWEFLAITTGLACVFTEWEKREHRDARLRLVWMQAFHWAAVLVAMNIMLLSGVQQLLPALATSLVLLMLLALGTFLAGLTLASLPICFLGFALALAVPTISWVKQSAIFLFLAGVALIGLVMAFWSRWSATRHGKPEPSKQSYPDSSAARQGGAS